MPHSYMWYDSFICDTCRHWACAIICVCIYIYICICIHRHTHINMCDMTCSYVWRDSSICVTWLIHTCDMTYSFCDVTQAMHAIASPNPQILQPKPQQPKPFNLNPWTLNLHKPVASSNSDTRHIAVAAITSPKPYTSNHPTYIHTCREQPFQQQYAPSPPLNPTP